MRKQSPNQLKNLKPVKKGEPSRNPKGSPTGPRISKKFKRMSAREVEKIGALILRKDLNALIAMKDDPKATGLMILVASCVVQAIKRGDVRTLDALLDRFIGKVTQKIDHKGLPETQNNSAVIVTIPANGYGAEEVPKNDKLALPKT